MIVAQSAKIGDGEMEVTALVPDPDKEGEQKEAVLKVPVVMVDFNLGIGGSLAVAIDPELAVKIADAMKRAANPTGLVEATLDQIPKGPVGIRDGVRQPQGR